MAELTKKLLSNSLIILISALIVWYWFRDANIIIGVDTIIPIRLSNYNQYFSLWGSVQAYSGADIFKLPVLFPLAFLLKLYELSGFAYSARVYEIIVVFILLASSGLTMQFLVRSSFKNISYSASFIAALFYMMNIYSTYLYNALPIYLLFSYAFFPLALAMYIKLLNKNRNYSFAILSAFIPALLVSTSYASTPYAALHAMVFVLYFFFYAISQRKRGRRYFFKTLALSFVFGLTYILMNAYWLVPVLLSNVSSAFSVVSGLGSVKNQFINNTTTFFWALRLDGWFGFESEYKGILFNRWHIFYRNPVVAAGLFIFPLLAIWGTYNLFKTRKKKSLNKTNYVFYLLLLIFSITMLILPTLPFSNQIIDFLISIKFLALFRTVYQRFTFLEVIALSTMMAHSLNLITEQYKNKFTKLLPYALITLIIVLAYPFISGQMFNKSSFLPSKRVEIPEYYFNSHEIVENEDFALVMVLPFNKIGLASLSWDKEKDGYDGFYPYLAIADDANYIYGDNKIETSSLLKQIEGSETLDKTIRALNVDFILLHEDTNWKFIQDNNWWVADDYIKVKELLQVSDCVSETYDLDGLQLYRIDENCKQSNTHSNNMYYPSINIGNTEKLIITQDYPRISIVEHDDEKENINYPQIIKLKNPLALEIDVWDSGWLWPATKYLPDSPLYRAVLLKETWDSRKVEGNTSLIDRHTWLSAKRIKELDRSDLNESQTATVNNQLQKHLNKVSEHIELLMLERENNLSHSDYEQIYKTRSYLIEIKDQEGVNSKSIELIDGILAEADLLLRTQCDIPCYEMDIEKQDIYTLLLDDTQKQVIVRNNLYEVIGEFNVTNSLTLPLKQGKYYLEIYRENDDVNELVEYYEQASAKSEDITQIELGTNPEFSQLFKRFKKNTPYEYIELKNIEQGNTYKINFDIDPQSETIVLFTLAEEYDEYTTLGNNKDVTELDTEELHRKSKQQYNIITEKLYTSDSDQGVFFYTPTDTLTSHSSVFLVFATINDNEQPLAEISNIRVKKLENTDPLYAIMQSENANTDYPNDVFDLKKINRYTYELSLNENPTQQVILRLDEVFDGAWSINEINSDVNPNALDNLVSILFKNHVANKYLNEISELKPIKLNGLYTGFIVNPDQLDKENTYIIKYRQQDNVILGLQITIVTIISVILIAFILLLRRSNKDDSNSTRDT